MGRKPNALILTHFQRGAKLNDSSNRYEHTCKACGEKFPKGRIDSLTNHLVKKCPAISLRDRQKALLELNNLPDLTEASRNRNGDVQMNGPTVELPIGTRNWTALETLAEVSRQIDMSEKHDGHPSEGAVSDNRSPEQQLSGRLELQEQYTLDNPPVSYEQRVQREKKGLKVNRQDRDNSLPLNFATHLSRSRSASPNLAMAAAAAAAATRFIPSMVDPALLADDSNDQHNMEGKHSTQGHPEVNAAMTESFFNGAPEQHASWPILEGHGGDMYPDPDNIDQNVDDTDSPRAGTYSRIAMNPAMTTEFSAEYGNGQKANKPKVRGRFTPVRRKEVQEVRKMGACIRCRMLKKQCSHGTPCNTCKSVEQARLWKSPCVRTRLAELVEMYSAGLHAVLAYHEVNKSKSRVQFRNSPHQIEASHYPETTIFAVFNALEGHETPGNIDPGLSGGFVSNTFRILDNDTDDLPTKLDAYMTRMSPVLFDREPSHFMNVTLNTAHALSIQKQDSLLGKVLTLWAFVNIIVDHELHWTLSERIEATFQDGQGPAIEQNAGNGTYALLCLQLSAAAEKKAAQMCKDVLNNIEQRLLARTSKSSFETFLVAIILLNCFEKSTWLFESWGEDGFKSRWPLDKPPAFYASQGDRVTNMLQMLLRMRSVLPTTSKRAEDGILIADGDQIARDYFEKLLLNYDDVVEKQTKHEFVATNSRCYELRFCSQLLVSPTTT